MNDECFEPLFENVISKTMEMFRPEVIVLQCGADSLAYDKLGHFNLSTKGHGKCIQFMKKFGVPLMILGGGGYTVANVARCWAYETALCLNQDIDLNY
jgi:histone deacetylase 1/2